MSRSGSSSSKRSARISGRGLKPARQITRDQLLGHIKPTLPLKLDHGVEKVVTMKCGGFLKCARLLTFGPPWLYFGSV